MADLTLTELTADLADTREATRTVLPPWFTAADVVNWYGCGIREAQRLLRAAVRKGVVRDRMRSDYHPVYCRVDEAAEAPDAR